MKGPSDLDPVTLADDVGSAYANGVTAAHRKDHGLYLTPPAVAHFMAGFATPRHGGQVRVLDPCSGGGILAAAAVAALVKGGTRQIHVVAYEIDPILAEVLDGVLSRTAKWADGRNTKVTFEIHPKDFVLANADALAEHGGFFEAGGTFDLVIANPPYFKLNKADPRAQVAASIIHGQPNVYALFMAIGAAMLKPGGDLVTITPRSFASGDYFRAFRRRFLSMVRPDTMHVFGSRRDTFARDAVLQENVVLHCVREDGWSGGKVVISTSAGVDDLDRSEVRTKALADVLDMRSPDLVLRMPATAGDEDLMRVVDGWTGSLKAHGLKISTGPVVAFRASEFQRSEEGKDTVPLMWLNHVHAMEIRWPLRKRKNEHVANVMASRSILVPNANYVLMRRFSAKEEKRRLVAAPYLAKTSRVPMLGLENHLNYVYRPGGSMTEEETVGLAAFMNSTLLDTWFRATNGNTQVGAAEIRAMPLPPMPAIIALGKRARGVTDLAEIDALVEVVLGAGADELVAA
jgi:adenine-specific DNA-methyltransferase